MSGDCSCVGQVCNLRRVFNPPSAGPGKILGARTQSGGHGIVFDVVRDAVELDGVPHPSVVRFVLPEGCPAYAQQLVALAGGESLQRLRDLADVLFRRDQQVDVIRHDDEIVGCESTFALKVAKGSYDHFGKLRPAQMLRAGTSCVEQPVHGNESFAVGCHPRKSAIGGQTSIQAPGEKDGMTDRVVVRQPADMEMCHGGRVRRESDFSHRSEGGLETRRRLQTCPTGRHLNA